MKNIFIILASIFLSLLSFAQTGPGGVGNSSTVAFWVDAHTDQFGNGFMVDTLTDYSGSGVHFTQANPALRPVYSTSAFNGVNGLQFSGVELMAANANPILNNNTFFDYYFFGKNNTPGSLALPVTYDYGPGRKAYCGILSLAGSNDAYGHNSGYALRRTTINSSTGYGLFQGRYNVPTGVLTGFFDFVQQSQITNANSPLPVTHSKTHLGGSQTGNELDGEIFEAFGFTTLLNSAEEKILQNYISAKYGTSILVDDYDYESTHQFGVVGIGREDASNQQLAAIGNGQVRIEKASLANGQYLYVGHNGEPLSNLNTDVPVLRPGSSRLKRVWRMDEPTDIGAITVTLFLDDESDFSPNPVSYELIVDTDGDGVFATGVPTFISGTYSAVNKTVTFTGVDMAAGDHFTLIADEPPTIFSVASGNWNNSATWNCGCVPSTSNRVTVAAGTNVTINVPVTVNQLVVASGGTLDWSGSDELTISGDSLVIAGTIAAGSGKITMGGVIDQFIDLKSNQVDLNSLEINNIGGDVTLMNGTILINRTLFPESGTFDFSAGSVIINSTSATQGGRVAEVKIDADFVGDVVVRRFIPAGIAGVRNLASPVINAKLSDWDDDLLISGAGFPDGCAYGPVNPTTNTFGCYYSVLQTRMGSYVILTSMTDTLENGIGFEVFMGDDLTFFLGTNVDVTGQLNTNDVTTPTFAGWNTLGNPFASPVLFSQALTTNFLGQYFYVFDANSGSYQWYDQVLNTSSIPTLANGLIATGQGFYVKDFGFLTFPQSSKTSTNATFIRNTRVPNQINLTLSQQSSTYFNVSSLTFDEAADDAGDDFDMHYLSTGAQKASTLYMEYIENDDTTQLTRNYLNRDWQEKVVDFKMNCLTETYYTITPSDISDLQDYEFVYLFDKALNKTVDLIGSGSYTFYSEVGTTDRFSIILTNEKRSEKTYIAAGADANTGDIRINQIGHAIEIDSKLEMTGGTIEVANVVGQKVLSNFALENIAGKQYLTLDNNLSGIFIVVVRAEGEIVATRKIIL